MSHDTTQKKPVDPEIVHPGAQHPDDVIHVPKGSNKTRFILTFLLVVLVLTTFTVSTQVLDVFSGRDQGSREFMTWKTPSGVTQKVSLKEFVEEKRALAYVLPMIFQSQRNEPNDEQTAAFIALDRSAAETGIVVTDQELREQIKQSFPSSEVYQNYCASMRTTPKEFETVLRRAARVNRYRDFLSQGMTLPDYKAVEANWKVRHQEYMYDYVEVPVASFVAEARAAAPRGDQLKAWFDALSEPEKAAYKTKAEVSAEVAGMSLEGPMSGDAVLAKFPRPEGRDVEKEARDYYDSFPIQRFMTSTPKPGQMPVKPWEEVKSAALAEAPVYYALMEWAASLQKREAAGEAIDLAAEAASIGLAYRRQNDPLNQEAWKDVYKNSFVGRRALDVAFDLERQAGKLWPAIVVDDKSFAFGRTLEVRPERTPEFGEIASRVESAWADKKARELALEKLEKLRDSLGTRPDPADANAPPFLPEADEAKFAEVVKAAGYTVQRRDWRDRFAPPPAAGEEPSGDAFIRMNATLTTLKETTVAKPELNREGTMAYLVRVGGLRDPDLSKMKVNELKDGASQQAMQEAFMFRLVKLTSKEYLQSRFGVDLASWKAEKTIAN